VFVGASKSKELALARSGDEAISCRGKPKSGVGVSRFLRRFGGMVGRATDEGGRIPSDSSPPRSDTDKAMDTVDVGAAVRLRVVRT
jgi:hypothetical protein